MKKQYYLHRIGKKMEGGIIVNCPKCGKIGLKHGPFKNKKGDFYSVDHEKTWIGFAWQINVSCLLAPLTTLTESNETTIPHRKN